MDENPDFGEFPNPTFQSVFLPDFTFLILTYGVFLALLLFLPWPSVQSPHPVSYVLLGLTVVLLPPLVGGAALAWVFTRGSPTSIQIDKEGIRGHLRPYLFAPPDPRPFEAPFFMVDKVSGFSLRHLFLPGPPCWSVSFKVAVAGAPFFYLSRRNRRRVGVAFQNWVKTRIATTPKADPSGVAS